MKTVVNRIALSSIGAFAIFSLCMFVLSGCDILFNLFNHSYDVEILSPDNGASFEFGDSIAFEMELKNRAGQHENNAVISKGTIIQWTSDADGDYWKEEIAQDVTGEGVVSYRQKFSTSALSAGDHTITCKIYETSQSKQILAKDSVNIFIRESQGNTSTTTTTDGGGGGNLDVTACTALDDLEVRAGEPRYYGNGAECWASIILKNNGMRAIQGGFYTDDSTINTTDPHEFKRDGWGFLYLDPGQEIEYTIQPSGWGYQPQYDGTTRTVITSKATAIYSEDGCMWILNEDLFSDGVIDAPLKTRDVSGLNPCQ